MGLTTTQNCPLTWKNVNPIFSVKLARVNTVTSALLTEKQGLEHLATVDMFIFCKNVVHYVRQAQLFKSAAFYKL